MLAYLSIDYSGFCHDDELANIILGCVWGADAPVHHTHLTIILRMTAHCTVQTAQ